MQLAINQVVIYEGRRCKIIELSDHKAKLENLSPIGDNDWLFLEVVLENIKEDVTK